MAPAERLYRLRQRRHSNSATSRKNATPAAMRASSACATGGNAYLFSRLAR